MKSFIIAPLAAAFCFLSVAPLLAEEEHPITAFCREVNKDAGPLRETLEKSCGMAERHAQNYVLSRSIPRNISAKCKQESKFGTGFSWRAFRQCTELAEKNRADQPGKEGDLKAQETVQKEPATAPSKSRFWPF